MHDTYLVLRKGWGDLPTGAGCDDSTAPPRGRDQQRRSRGRKTAEAPGHATRSGFSPSPHR
ncbi:hypothetical protein SNL152K_2942 [Streptomyces sp. NL15-2K]|nr:hypothetical protein SNL152K_2942 [Streptomyces sp. NL15-2K]